MAKVRAIPHPHMNVIGEHTYAGFDGRCMRAVGDVFDVDPAQFGIGSWFEYLDKADEDIARAGQVKRNAERRLRPQIEGEIAAAQRETLARDHAALEARVRAEIEAEYRAKAVAK